MAKLEDDSTSSLDMSLDQKQVPSHETMESTPPPPPPPPHHLPWLLLDAHHPFYIQNQCFRIGRAVPRTFESNPKTLHYERNCVGSVEGWLIMTESIKSSPIVNCFMDPLSNARVALPSQSTIGSPENHRHNFFHKVVASSAPMGQQRCLVAGIVAGPVVDCIEVRHDLALCRLNHKSWTIIKVAEVEDHELLFCDIEIIDRKLYAATKNMLMVFHIKDTKDGRCLSYKLVETVTLQYNKPVNWPYDHYGLDKDWYKPFSKKDRYKQIFEDGPYLVKDDTSVNWLFDHWGLESLDKDRYMKLFEDGPYLVKDDTSVNWLFDHWGLESLDKDRYMKLFEDGPYLVKDVTSKELFMIFRDVTLLHSLPITYCTEGFRVLKLENCIANSSNWVEVSDLGDRMLFLSKFSNQLIYAVNGVSGYSHDKTLLERINCICFAFNWPGVILPGGDFGVFSLTNKRVIPLTFPEDQCPAELFEGNTVWFNPNA